MHLLAIFSISVDFSTVGPQLANAGSNRERAVKGKDDGTINRVSEGLLFG